jgi:branched-chain amino acid transport system substrate-binding protein
MGMGRDMLIGYFVVCVFIGSIVKKLFEIERFRVFVALALICSPFGVVQAQLILGHLSSHTGAFAGRIKENAEGAQAYFKKINAAGGVYGQQIEVQLIDDTNDPVKAGKLAEEFAAKPENLAIFMPGGTPNTDAIAKVTDNLGVPVVAPSNGASIFHSPIRKSVFNLRAPYQLEAQQLIRLLNKLQMTKFALLYQDDSFGKDAVAGAERGLEQSKLKPVLVKTFDRLKPDVDAISAAVIAADVEVIVFLGSVSHAVPIYKQVKAAKPQVALSTISNSATMAFVKSLGDLAPGVYVSQVMPGELSTFPFVREMAVDFPGGRAAMSPAHIEGYLAAKLMVEALKRAGKAPTRAKILAALEGMSNVDLGGFNVAYSATDHTGLEYIDLSIISRKGTFLR